MLINNVINKKYTITPLSLSNMDSVSIKTHSTIKIEIPNVFLDFIKLNITSISEMSASQNPELNQNN